ncbi:MAG TPA: Mur ligase domain-containing protein, partial [Gemmatimonadales bacterium]|nr:Mur ligase domain-containing protein [Gemmatimonadales bacterium]
MSSEKGPATPPWSEASVREALRLPPATGKQQTFSGIFTDSRAIQPEALFVALAGERFDGHDHLTAALAAGATGAV